MFKKQEYMKNTYLQVHFQDKYPNLTAIEINKYEKNFEKYSQNSVDKELNIPAFNTDIFILAFGGRALPKIILEMEKSKDATILQMCLNKLTNLLMNPIECTRAINDFKIAKRLERIFLDKLSSKNFFDQNNLQILELVFKNMEILTDHYHGAFSLYVQNRVMYSLLGMLIDEKYEKFPAAKILSKIASFPMIANSMVEDRSYHTELYEILECLKSNELHDFYMLLFYLTAKCPSEIYDAGYYPFFLKKVQTISDPSKETYDSTLIQILMKTFAHLLNVENAKLKFIEEENGIEFLYKLFSMDLSCDMLENIALALQNCTTSSNALFKCKEFQDLPLFLIQKAYYKQDTLQLYCLQTLRQITVMPCIKDFVRKNFKRQIKNIITNTEIAKERKKSLLNWLRKKNYKNVIENMHPILGEKNEKDGGNKNILAEFIQNEFSKKPRDIVYRLDYCKMLNGDFKIY